MSDENDDLLGGALRAEASGVEARRELLDQINAIVSTPQARVRRRGRLLAVAAAVALTAGTVALLARDDNDARRLDVVDRPTTDRTMTDGSGRCAAGAEILISPPVDAAATDIDALGQALRANPRITEARLISRVDASNELTRLRSSDANNLSDAPAMYLVYLPKEEVPAFQDEIQTTLQAGHSLWVICSDPPDPVGMAPDFFVLVREDGWLVTVDRASSMERELVKGDDPREPPHGGTPYVIDDVELSPDSKWIYFSTCCEPAASNTYRIPVDEPTEPADAELVAVGSHPRLSPDGRFLATAAGDQLIVVRADGGDTVAEYELDGSITELGWSPNGRLIGAIIMLHAIPDRAATAVLDFAGGGVDECQCGDHMITSFVYWRTDGSFADLFLTELPGVRHVRQDRTYQWGLYVSDDGVVGSLLVGAPGESDSGAPIPGLPRAIAADW